MVFFIRAATWTVRPCESDLIHNAGQRRRSSLSRNLLPPDVKTREKLLARGGSSSGTCWCHTWCFLLLHYYTAVFQVAPFHPTNWQVWTFRIELSDENAAAAGVRGELKQSKHCMCRHWPFKAFKLPLLLRLQTTPPFSSVLASLLEEQIKKNFFALRDIKRLDETSTGWWDHVAVRHHVCATEALAEVWHLEHGSLLFLWPFFLLCT